MDYTHILDRLKNRYNLIDDKALANLLGVSPAVMSNWRLGKNNPRLDLILEKALRDQVSLDWLFAGVGDMLLSPPPSQSNTSAIEMNALEEEARKIQAMFDRGLIKIDRGEKDAGSASGQSKEGHQELAITIPVFAHAIAAGKPVTCSGTIEEYITISANRVKHPKDTYAVKAFGDSMKDAGILEGDLLIVDRAIEPLNNHIVIASINDEQTVKRLRVKKGSVSLIPENSSYKPIEISVEMDFRTLGVVTYVVRKTA